MNTEKKYKSMNKIYFIYFFSMLLFCYARYIFAGDTFANWDPRQLDIFSSVLIQVGIMFFIPMVLYTIIFKKKERNVFKISNFQKINARTVLICIALGFIVFILTIITSSLFNGIIASFGYQAPIQGVGQSYQIDASVKNFFIDLLLVAVLPGFCEEFLHRGILLQGTKHQGFFKSIAISSLFFGLIHFNINQFFYAAIVGLFLGFVSVVAKNIWVPMIIHFVNNGISVYLDYASANKWFAGNFFDVFNSFSQANMITVIIIVSIVLIIVSLLAVLLVMQLYNQNILNKVNRAIKKVNVNQEYNAHKSKIIEDMLENHTMINLDYESMKSPIEIVMPKQKSVFEPTIKDKVFFYASLYLGVFVTFSTFIWGVL